MKRCRPLLGTFVEIEADDCAAIDLAFAAIERVHSAMSAHDPDSDLGRVNRGAHLAPIAIGAWTVDVLERALHWSHMSDGCFDVVRAGGLALERGAIPRHTDQPAPRADWNAMSVASGAVRLALPGCVDLGGIGKGFAVDRAIDALKAAGAPRGLVNAGGDLSGYGPQPWRVTLVDPVRRRPVALIDLIDSALATSAGVWGDPGHLSFDHLPGRDPRWSSVTVRAANAVDADALTKIAASGSVTTARCLRSAGAEAFAIRADGSIETIAGQARAA